MIMSLLEFLKSKIGIYIIFSVIFAFMYLMVINYKTKADLYKNELNTCNYSIGIQNKAVLLMKKTADDELEKQKELNARIEKDKLEEYKKLKHIFDSKVPEDCQQAIKWGIEHSDYTK